MHKHGKHRNELRNIRQQFLHRGKIERQFLHTWDYWRFLERRNRDMTDGVPNAMTGGPVE